MLEARMKKASLSKTTLDFDENGNKAQQLGARKIGSVSLFG